MRQIPPAGYRESLDVAAAAIGDRIDVEPRVGLILGSGLGAFADTLANSVAIPYEEIPGWPSSTVEGHAGQLVVGTHRGAPAFGQAFKRWFGKVPSEYRKQLRSSP